MLRQLRAGAVTAAVLALLGSPLGLLWEWVAPRPEFVIVSGGTVIADPESQAFITADGWYAVLTGGVGLVSGMLAYIWAGRRKRPVPDHGLHDAMLLVGLAAGGLAGAYCAWKVGHVLGQDTFQQLVRAGRDGTSVTGSPDLRAVAAVFLWPLMAVLMFGALDVVDVVGRHDSGPAGGTPEPADSQSETGSSETNQPGTSSSETDQPAASQPAASQVETDQAETGQSGTGQATGPVG